MDLATSLETGPHAQLARALGRWRGTARLWFEPGILAAEDPVTGEISSVGAAAGCATTTRPASTAPSTPAAP